MSLTGYRMQYVDLLNELLEKEPHGYAVLQKRVLGVATAKRTVTPSKLAKGKREVKLAQQIAEDVEARINAIPDLTQHLAGLLWANYYALAGREIHWVRDGKFWVPQRLSMIHSRRLAYPVSQSWDLYLYDQGGSFQDTGGAKRGAFGLRIADFPGKFIIHAAQVRGDYPTREGLGRQLAYWFALKLIASRGAPQYLERFTKPWPHASYLTEENGQKRPATDEDIEQAKAALDMMGGGNLKSWVHADSIEVDFLNPDGSNGKPKLTYGQWIDICNAEMSKVANGGTLGTDVSESGGNRALGETQRKGEVSLLKFDGDALAGTLTRDLVMPYVRLNYPDAIKLVPELTIHVEDDPDPIQIIERGAKAAGVGMPVDADELAKQAGVPLIDLTNKKSRRLVLVKATDPVSFDEDMARRVHEVRELYPAPPANDGTQPKLDKDGKPMPEAPESSEGIPDAAESDDEVSAQADAEDDDE